MNRNLEDSYDEVAKIKHFKEKSYFAINYLIYLKENLIVFAINSQILFNDCWHKKPIQMNEDGPQPSPAGEFRGNTILLTSEKHSLKVLIGCSNEFSEFLHQMTDKDFENVVKS